MTYSVKAEQRRVDQSRGLGYCPEKMHHGTGGGSCTLARLFGRGHRKGHGLAFMEVVTDQKLNMRSGAFIASSNVCQKD